MWEELPVQFGEIFCESHQQERPSEETRHGSSAQGQLYQETFHGSLLQPQPYQETFHGSYPQVQPYQEIFSGSFIQPQSTHQGTFRRSYLQKQPYQATFRQSYLQAQPSRGECYQSELQQLREWHTAPLAEQVSQEIEKQNMSQSRQTTEELLSERVHAAVLQSSSTFCQQSEIQNTQQLIQQSQRRYHSENQYCMQHYQYLQQPTEISQLPGQYPWETFQRPNLRYTATVAQFPQFQTTTNASSHQLPCIIRKSSMQTFQPPLLQVPQQQVQTVQYENQQPTHLLIQLPQEVNQQYMLTSQQFSSLSQQQRSQLPQQMLSRNQYLLPQQLSNFPQQNYVEESQRAYQIPILSVQQPLQQIQPVIVQVQQPLIAPQQAPSEVVLQKLIVGSVCQPSRPIRELVQPIQRPTQPIQKLMQQISTEQFLQQWSTEPPQQPQKSEIITDQTPQQILQQTPSSQFSNLYESLVLHESEPLLRQVSQQSVHELVTTSSGNASIPSHLSYQPKHMQRQQQSNQQDIQQSQMQTLQRSLSPNSFSWQSLDGTKQMLESSRLQPALSRSVQDPIFMFRIMHITNS
uniref:Uncharacterized protein n=1 Tax=Setaria digitata TaxID=48799 RepID=A0A915PJ50_9BILA